MYNLTNAEKTVEQTRKSGSMSAEQYAARGGTSRAQGVVADTYIFSEEYAAEHDSLYGKSLDLVKESGKNAEKYSQEMEDFWDMKNEEHCLKKR